MMQSSFNLLQRFRGFVSWLWDQEGTPAQRARGMAVGVFSGCFPFFGFQTLLGVMLASLFRGNRLIAAAGTWISNPFTYVPLYWFNYKIGSFFLGVGHSQSNFYNLDAKEVWSQGWLASSRLLLGSAFVGIILGMITGFSFYLVLKKYSKERI